VEAQAASCVAGKACVVSDDMRQREALLNHLTTKGPITKAEAIGLYGILNPAGRICDLKAAGHKIATSRRAEQRADGSVRHVAEYRLASESLCEVCGAPYVANKRTQRLCASDACAQEMNRRRQRERARSGVHRLADRRAALMRQARGVLALEIGALAGHDLAQQAMRCLVNIFDMVVAGKETGLEAEHVRAISAAARMVAKCLESGRTEGPCEEQK
jgi:predicted nucleic acid-binding Zn ribbon protein